jgi:hypothetical protein
VGVVATILVVVAGLAPRRTTIDGAVSTLEVASHLTAEVAAIVEAGRVLVVREIPSR